MHKYKIKISPQQLLKLKQWWSIYKMIEDDFWGQIKETEKKMAKDLKIKDIEFFFCDNECAGIGNTSKTLKLMQRDELE